VGRHVWHGARGDICGRGKGQQSTFDEDAQAARGVAVKDLDDGAHALQLRCKVVAVADADGAS